MADDTLVSERTLERPSEGQVERASDTQPQRDTDGQPSDKGQAAQDNENIRKLQSTYDKKLAERERTFQSQQQQMQQTIQQLQREMREAQKNSAPSDYDKLALELQWAMQERDQYANLYQQDARARADEDAKKQVLQEIVGEFDLVTVDDLIKTDTTVRASVLAAKLQAEREKKKQTDKADKAERNAPDIGGGAPRTTQSEWERNYQDAQNRKDTPEMMRLLRARGK